MHTCLPFLIGLVLYSGMIIINLFDLLRHKTAVSNCMDETTKSIRIKSNVCGVISGIVLITVIYFLCKYKHEKIAWAVILIPIVMVMILFLTILYKIQSLTVRDLNDAKLNG
ncbi:MAG: hypothetical protein PHG66_00880 [Candidatus Colwellbacteria bacterium]|nr:hypothetical protein [Candidatus Colwellbacteria bacterium]